MKGALAVLLAVWPCAARVAAQEVEPVAASRARWERMSVQERELLRERFETWKQLPAETRRAIEERSRKLRALERRLLEAMGEAERVAFRRLDASGRERLLLEQMRDEMRAHGRRVRDKLPADLVERLEGAPALERPRILDEFHRSRRRGIAPALVERLARAAGKPAREIAALRRLGPEELADVALRLERETITRRIEDHGAPPGLTRAAFRGWRNLGDREFFERWRALDPPRDWLRDGRPSDRGRDERHARFALLRELQRLSRPGMDDRLAVHDRPGSARREALAERIRARTLPFLERKGLAGKEELGRLRRLRGPRYVAALRDLLRRLEHELRAAADARPGRRDALPPVRDRRR